MIVTPDDADDPAAEAREWLAAAHADIFPKIADAVLTIQIAPGDEPDPKVAIELGYTLLLDKPLIVVVPEGRPVPDHLRRAADEVIPWSEDMAPAVLAAIRRFGGPDVDGVTG